MRTRHAVAVSMLAVVGTLSSAVPVGAAVAGNGRISFTRWDYEAVTNASYSILPDGTDLQPILAEGRRTTAAAYSPDGTQIAVDVFQAGAHHLRIIDLDGNVISEVASFGSDIDQISWSPNAERLVIGRGDRITVMRVEGTQVHEIVSDGDSPRWSPDGRWILFDRLLRRGNDFLNNLYLIHPNGTGRHLVVRNGYLGAWSPSGGRIAFYRFTESDVRERRAADLFIAGLDGSWVRRLTDTPWRSEGPPVWSPNGNWLAFSRWWSSDVYDGDIVKLNLETGRTVRLTSSPLDDWIPLDWQRVPA
jgi:Tol biopolymer transport system component